MNFAIGIDLGGTNTVLGAVDEQGRIVGQTSFPTTGYPDFGAYFEQLTAALRTLLPLGHLVGIGLGSPAGNRFGGHIQAPSNVGWQGSLPVGRLLHQAFGVPVAIDNDANAAAIGEMLYGAARGLKDFMVITLGTGLGSGIVIDGRLLYGASGFAGELGHLVAVRGGRQCACGKRGCLETYVSATGIRRTLAELLGQSNAPSRFRHLAFDAFDARDIHTAALEGDALAMEAFRLTGDTLGRALADYTAFSEPSAFILFGGLAHAGPLLMEPTQRAFDEELLFLYRNKVQLLFSELMHNNAAVLGSAALAWAEVRNQPQPVR